MHPVRRKVHPQAEKIFAGWAWLESGGGEFSSFSVCIRRLKEPSTFRGKSEKV